MQTVKCFQCGKDVKKYPSQIKLHKKQFCNRACKSEWNKTLPGFWLGKRMSNMARQNMSANHADFSGSKNGRWKGGKRVDKNGYILVQKKDHPYCDRHGYVRQHRLIMEKKIGRYLEPKEVVHHKDHDKQNNKTGNLLLLKSGSEHSKLHYQNGDTKHLRYSPGWKQANSQTS